MARPLKKRTPQEIVKIVTAIRRKNNEQWMRLLVLALQSKPRKAKAIVRKIVENDKKVSLWMGRV